MREKEKAPSDHFRKPGKKIFRGKRHQFFSALFYDTFAPAGQLACPLSAFRSRQVETVLEQVKQGQTTSLLNPLNSIYLGLSQPI